jgi:hypothetical protein
MVGTTAGGIISPARIRKLISPFQRVFRRCSTKPTMAEKITSSVTLATVRMVELTKAVTSIQFLVVTTSTTLSQRWKLVGQVKSRRAASGLFLTEVRMMKAKGTRKTIVETRMAVALSQWRRRMFIRDPPGD